MWHMTFDMWHMTFDMWHMTRVMWNMTCDMFVGVNIPSKSSSLALTVCDLWFYEDLEEMAHWMNESRGCL